MLSYSVLELDQVPSDFFLRPPVVRAKAGEGEGAGEGGSQFGARWRFRGRVATSKLTAEGVDSRTGLGRHAVDVMVFIQRSRLGVLNAEVVPVLACGGKVRFNTGPACRRRSAPCLMTSTPHRRHRHRRLTERIGRVRVAVFSRGSRPVALAVLDRVVACQVERAAVRGGKVCQLVYVVY